MRSVTTHIPELPSYIMLAITCSVVASVVKLSILISQLCNALTTSRPFGPHFMGQKQKCLMTYTAANETFEHFSAKQLTFSKSVQIELSQISSGKVDICVYGLDILSRRGNQQVSPLVIV